MRYRSRVGWQSRDDCETASAHYTGIPIERHQVMAVIDAPVLE
jgi:hypothetical protein